MKRDTYERLNAVRVILDRLLGEPVLWRPSVHEADMALASAQLMDPLDPDPVADPVTLAESEPSAGPVPVPLCRDWVVRSRVTGAHGREPLTLDRAREQAALMNRSFGVDHFVAAPLSATQKKGPRAK